MLAIIAPVGAGAPPVEVEEDEEAVADADAAEIWELAEDLMELIPAVREDATEDKGELLVAEPALFI